MYKKDKVEKALKYSRDILDSVGLKSWRVETDNSYSIIAKTRHDKKKIIYSKRYIKIATEEEFRKTTIHEATHALLGYGKKHGNEFIKLCNRLSPSTSYSRYCAKAPIHKYFLTCSRCGNIGTTNTNAPLFCEGCAAKGTGVYKLARTYNYLDVTEWASKQ